MILVHPPRAYPDGDTRSHAASDGSLHELFLFAEALGLDLVEHFVEHPGMPHLRIPAGLFDAAVALGYPNVREAPREEMAAAALTRRQIEGTRVVNLEHERCDVRIDRPTRWGNPYRIGEHGTRPEVLDLFRRDFQLRPSADLLDSLRLLKGRALGCHCKPKPCHGDVYVDMIRGVPAPQEALF